MTEALIDTLSPLTSQPMESDDSWIIKDSSPDIIHYLYGQCQGTAILHQRVWDRVTTEYDIPADPGDPRNNNDPDENDQSSHRGRYNPPRDRHPEEGPPEDPDNDDPA